MPGMLVNVSMCVYCLEEITFFSSVYIWGFASTSISVSTCGKIPWLWSYFTGFIMTCKRCFFQLAPKKSLVNWDPLYSISPYAPLSHQEAHRVKIISHRPSKIRCHLLYYRQFVFQMIYEDDCSYLAGFCMFTNHSTLNHLESFVYEQYYTNQTMAKL